MEAESTSTLLLRQPEYPRDECIRIGAEAIQEGNIVAFPTETVYGLGANVYNEKAILSVFAAKGRPADNPLIVHISDVEQAEELAMQLPGLYSTLAARYFPGPLTLIVKRNAAVLDCVTGGLDTVALRMPDHPLALELIHQAGVPIVGPSANLSGRVSPVKAQQVMNDLDGQIYAVLDGGECSVGIESTVLDITSDRPVVLRPGVISAEDLSEILGMEVPVESSHTEAPRSPGTKYRHYEPELPLTLLLAGANQRDRLEQLIRNYTSAGKRIALLAPESYKALLPECFFSFGGGTAIEYARALYSGLRYFTSKDGDILLCLGIEETGVGMAVMNRLRKSASEVVE